MLYLTAADRVEPLAERLAEVLSVPPGDPMTREWVAVPSAGMQRWLSLELARHLGSGGRGSADGIAANIEFGFPGSLRQRVFEAGRISGADPWR
ncbi:MAG: exodeoxyribonuclease V subunit gamma, partial [Acidimicrobiales bacterium]